MRHRRSLRTAALLLAALPLLLAGCGDDEQTSSQADEPASSESPETGAAGGLAVTDGSSPDELLACLTEAGLPAVLDDAVPFGVEVPVEGIEVEPLGTTTGGDTQGAALWVFTDPAAAEENRGIITLSDEDGPSSWVAGNVVVDLDYPAAEGDAEVDLLRGCLPA